MQKLDNAKEQVIEVSADMKYSNNTEHLNLLFDQELLKLRDIKSGYRNVENNSPVNPLFSNQDKHNLYKTVLSEYKSTYSVLLSNNFNNKRFTTYHQTGEFENNGMKIIKKALDGYDMLSKAEFEEQIKAAKIGKEHRESFTRSVYTLIYSHLTHDNYTRFAMTPITRYSHPIIKDGLEDDVVGLFKDKYYGFGIELSRNTCKLSTSKEYSVSYTFDDYLFNYKRNLIPNDYKKFFDSAFLEIYGIENTSSKVMSINCHITYNNYKQNYKKFYKKAFGMHPMFSKEILSVSKKKITPEFVNKSPIHRLIAMNILHRNFRIIKEKTLTSHFKGRLEGKYEQFYRTVDLRSPEAFSESITKFLNDIAKDKFYKKVKENGLDMDFLRDQKFVGRNLFEVPRIKEQIKKNFPFFIHNGKVTLERVKDQYNQKDFIAHLAKMEKRVYKEVLKDTKLMDADNKYEALGDGFAKAFVAIPIVLTISTFMILLSIINLIVKVVEIFEVEKVNLHLTRLGLFILIIAIPMVLPNKFFNNSLVNGNENKMLKISVKWVMNTQPVMDVLHIDTKFVNSGYNLIKYTSYLTAESYNRITGKDKKKSDNLKLKMRHHKKEFNYRF